MMKIMFFEYIQGVSDGLSKMKTIDSLEIGWFVFYFSRVFYLNYVKFDLF